jgi:calcineurin-like phosphoesterase family protein
MSTPRFIADTHMGHRNIWKYRPLFESTLHNDLYFQYVLAEVCTKRDTMFFLGDVIFDEKYLDFIKELPGSKILIMGNHCSEYIPTKKLCEAFDEVHSLLKYKEFWLSHAPIHPEELRGKKNVHGHVHTASVSGLEYLNVSVDSSFMNFFPKTLHEVRVGFETVNSTQQIFAGVPEENSLSALETNAVAKALYHKALEDSRKLTV